MSTTAHDTVLSPPPAGAVPANEGTRFPIAPARDKVRRRPDQDNDLEHIIASPAGLRVLGVLVNAQGPMNPPSIAKASGVALMSVHRTLVKLEPLGFTTAVGEGRLRLYRMPEAHPARPFLRRFFRWVKGDANAAIETANTAESLAAR